VTNPRTLSEALVAAADADTGITVLEHDGRSLPLTYRHLLRDACLIGGALHARGLRPGDRVALVLPEVNEFIRAFFGISAAGLVPVPLCPPAQAGDLATFSRQSHHVLTAARVAALVTSADVAPLLELTGLDPLPIVVTLDDLCSGPALEAPIPVALDAMALLQFTSGSTAAPKGVMLSHRNLHANVTAIAGPDGLDTTSADVAVSWLPLYHDMGLIGMLIVAVYQRAHAVILSPVLFLKRPSAWLEAISTHRGTVSFAPNFAYDLCRRRVKPSQIAALDLSSWRVAGCGAEPIRPESLRAFAEHFAKAGFRESNFVPSYGLAEHSLAVTLGRAGMTVDVVDAERLVRESRAVGAANGAPSVRVVGCGRSFPGHALKIVDDNFADLPERHVGSIVVSGPSVMEGYFDDPEATQGILRDGWLQTGDLGYLADGELYVCGRTKDLIIRQGRKYHPPDLESAIAEVRGIPVSGVVVFGISHVEDADEVVAVLEARASARADEIIDAVRRRVRETAGLELDRVVVTPPGTIPRTTSGKVRRAETRARFEAGTLTKTVATATAADR
jgi:fatty-acyl-CoA synthase